MFETKAEIQKFIEETFSQIDDNNLDYLRYSFGRNSYYYQSGDSTNFSPEEELRQIVGASWCESGASKIVFGWDNIPDIVIKVPFKGRGIFDIDENTLKSFEDFYCAGGSDCGDYCAAEANVYAEAKARDLENFFCSTEFICELNGIKYYASTKAKGYWDVKHPEVSEDSEEKAYSTDDGNLYIDVDILSIFYEQNEDEAVEEIINFLQDMDTNDFHTGNLGFIDGCLVFLDYSGFND